MSYQTQTSSQEQSSEQHSSSSTTTSSHHIMQAPEIDPAGIAGGLTLLVLCILVITGRKLARVPERGLADPDRACARDTYSRHGSPGSF